MNNYIAMWNCDSSYQAVVTQSSPYIHLHYHLLGSVRSYTEKQTKLSIQNYILSHASCIVIGDSKCCEYCFFSIATNALTWPLSHTHLSSSTLLPVDSDADWLYHLMKCRSSALRNHKHLISFVDGVCYCCNYFKKNNRKMSWTQVLQSTGCI